LCAPVCIRTKTEISRTWVAYEEKEDLKLLCWSEAGVDSSADITQLAVEKSEIQSLLSVDESGQAILVIYKNSQIHCYKEGKSERQWTWEIPSSSSLLRTFKATDSLLTQKLEGFVLLVVSDQARLYTISAETQPTETTVSIPLNDVCLLWDELISVFKGIIHRIRCTLGYSLPASETSSLPYQAKSRTDYMSSHQQIRHHISTLNIPRSPHITQRINHLRYDIWNHPNTP
jgi:hypothetical protein